MSFPISYEIIYSKRKSVAIQIRPDGQVIVRAPMVVPVPLSILSSIRKLTGS